MFSRTARYYVLFSTSSNGYFVSENKKVTDKIQQAKTFDTKEEASSYIKENEFRSYYFEPMYVIASFNY